ncbi:LacI family transcriptional regulator [Aquibacillus sp. 3ASR75-11]|uniref:LacI family transcriptional regulator n=1 Tax=Terrihalobacillus insolitus TaxID=2950438 RepID=A0A9X4AKN2_9BACI|nr:LacI family DNA-binding transcriptional regulator [Terrihalobacillus insolitus]MDC3423281.1 LacI family transcriptional regulator [Terrihalobacillus insolitus]
MATIKDVAKLAQVSVATVSRVLNSNGYVNPTTKERVNKAISDLNYRPNDVARSLFKGRSKMIALFVPDIMNPYFPELARAVEDVTNQHDYTFVLCNTDDDIEKEITYLNALQQKSVDGIIIVSSTINKEHIQHINVPIIALDRILSSDLSSVTVTNREGAKEATEYLKEIGCERIAHICGPENASNTVQRLRGYLDVVKDEDWFLSSYVVSGGYNFDKAVEVTINLLKDHPEVDGIFAANDVMGVGVMKAAQSLGLRVPEDLSIIGFDGIALGKTTSPSLTTMAQPIYDIGARAAEILIEHINDKELLRKREEFTVKLIERESTKVRR